MQPKGRNRKKGERPIKMNQIHLARSRFVAEQIGRYAAENSIDLLLMQEPYTYRGKVNRFEGEYKIVQVMHGVVWAAIALRIADCTVTQVSQATTTETAMAQIDIVT